MFIDKNRKQTGKCVSNHTSFTVFMYPVAHNVPTLFATRLVVNLAKAELHKFAYVIDSCGRCIVDKVLLLCRHNTKEIGSKS